MKTFAGYEEYHYGSDFGDSSDENEPDEDLLLSPSDSDSLAADNDNNDSDFSMSSFSNESNVPTRKTRCPTPDPLWLQARELPPLSLPDSSDDLLIPKQYGLKAASIYEVFRRFKGLVRLTPFRLEDFCAAIVSEEQSALLTEVHVMLLKALLREEDAQTTHFGPLDQKDSINISMYLIDPMTWPDVLKNYLESDPAFDQTVLDILTKNDYPYVGIDKRLIVLQFLTDQLLITTAVRDDLIREGPIHYDDHCRICHKLGDLLCCETCPAVFHLDCVDPPLVNVPTGDYQCNLCKAQQLPGVYDCISSLEKQGFLCRYEHLGYDRHGRKYWFICRRIFVESEETGDVWYYSTVPQLEQLLSHLDAEEMEASLCAEIAELREEIDRQMTITETVTNKHKGNKKSYLEVENQNIADKLKKEKEATAALENGVADSASSDEASTNEKTEKTVKTEKPDKKEQKESGDEAGDDAPATPVVSKNVVTTRLKTGSLTPRNYSTDDLKRKSLGSAAASKEDSDSDTRLTRLKVNQIATGTLLFKLGMENSHKTYVNHFTTNKYALNKPQRNEERNKERYLSHEFSLTPASEFKWIGVLNGTHTNVISTLRQTMTALEQSIATPFMHPHWPALRKLWLQAISHCKKPTEFAKALIIFQACIKSPVFTSVWQDKLGHLKLQRISLAEREEKKKLDKREKRERDDEEERNRLSINFVKYSLGLKHQVAKLKGEEYRIHGQWSWVWMSYGRKQHPLARRPEEFITPIHVMSKVRGENGVEKVVVLTSSTYAHLKSHDPDVKSELMPIIDKFDKIDVSSALQSTNRLLYPKIAKTSVLDDLLKRRIELKSSEERKIASAANGTTEPPANIITKPKSRPFTDVEKQLQKIAGIRSHASASSAVAAIPNLDVELVTKLAKDIQATRSQFSKLNRLAKQYKCYPGCEVNASTFSLPQARTASCYSPLCLQKARVKRELLVLLRKAHTAGNGSKETVAAIMNIVNRKPSILEAKLTEGKLSGASETSAEGAAQSGAVDPAKLRSNILTAFADGIAADDENDVLKYIVIKEETPESKAEPTTAEATVKVEDFKVEAGDVKMEDSNGTESNGSDEKPTVDTGDETQPAPKKPRLNESVSEVDVVSSQDDDTNPSTAAPTIPVTDIEKDELLNTDDSSREGRRSSRRSVKNRTSVKTTATTTRTTTKYSDGSEEHETNSVVKTRTKDVSYDANRTYTTLTDSSVVGQSQYVRKPNRRFAATAKAIKRDTTVQEVKEVAADGTERVYSCTSTRGRVYLSKTESQQNASRVIAVQSGGQQKVVASLKYPPMATFMTQRAVRSMMALHRIELRRLARTGGRLYVNGFNSLMKPNMAIWPYPCSRPSFKMCWLYRTMSARTLAAVALQLRILWCCLRWDDMAKRPPTHDGKYQETTETEISTMEILKHRICGRFSEKTQYLRRKVVIPLEMPKTIRGECRWRRF